MSKLVTAMILLGVLAGCGDDGPALDGRTFLLQSATGFTPVSGTTVRLAFDDGRLDASANCNSMSAPYEVRDDVLSVGPLSSTNIGCARERQAQDEAISALLRAKPKLTLADQTLTLRGANATLIFLDRVYADPDRPFVGTIWTVDTELDGGSASTGPGGATARVSFAMDGTFTVAGPCNSAKGTYTLTDKLTIVALTKTPSTCWPDARTFDEHLWSVFAPGAKLTYSIEASALRIENGKLGVAGQAK